MAISAATALAGAGAASNIIGGLKGNKQKAMPTTTFRPMGDTLSDFDQLRERLMELQQFQARPTRHLRADEMEGDFANKAVMDIQNYYNTEYPNDPNALDDQALADMGRQYVDAYGASGEVNPTYWQNLQQQQKFNYADIARKLMEIQSNPDSFSRNEAALRDVGLGYMPRVLPKGIGMPSSGIPMQQDQMAQLQALLGGR